MSYTVDSIITLCDGLLGQTPHAEWEEAVWMLSKEHNNVENYYPVMLQITNCSTYNKQAPLHLLGGAFFFFFWETNNLYISQFPTFYRTQGFIIVFTRAWNWVLSWADESSPHPPILFLYINFYYKLFLCKTVSDRPGCHYRPYENWNRIGLEGRLFK
jgi:hypothetical protein